MVYIRSKLRVHKYIVKNIEKFNDIQQVEANSLRQIADTYLSKIHDTMKLCKTKCDECFYPCLLCKNHEDDEDFTIWSNPHKCNQGDHFCKENCNYCQIDEKKKSKCGMKSGHSGKHHCRKSDHTCEKKCDLKEFPGCQTYCTLQANHSGVHRCAAGETHYCKELCAVKICQNSCKQLYNSKHEHHICFQSSCPSKCQVKCWNSIIGKVVECGRPCACNGHDHSYLQESDEKVNQNELHICDQAHPCPEECNTLGNCKVEVQRRIVKKESYFNRANERIEYDSYAEVNAEKKRCAIQIPKGKFKHDDNLRHHCQSETEHTCDQTCDSCGYFCDKRYGHFADDSESFHDCMHGNMRFTTFYTPMNENMLDVGDDRRYGAGDLGIAEMCNMFCQRLGRGHIHLEPCAYEGKTCVEEKERRHETTKYAPNPSKPKDEVKHNKFWRRKQWEDPCLDIYKDSFDLCDFACQHPSHKQKKAMQTFSIGYGSMDNKQEEEEEQEKVKYCSDKLWHKKCPTASGHMFECSHPFYSAHIVFICDKSGSMCSDDKGKSVATYEFISKAGYNNRMGALYSAIHDFINSRIDKGCSQQCTAILFDTKAHVASQKCYANRNYVQKYLLKYRAGGSTDFYVGFKKAQELINLQEDTVVIFLTDGQASDNGTSELVKTLKIQMQNKFRLFCIALGSTANQGKYKGNMSGNMRGKMRGNISGNMSGNMRGKMRGKMRGNMSGNKRGNMIGNKRGNMRGKMSVIEQICASANGTMLSALTGDELGETFGEIVKQLNAGTFAVL
eukprot:347803_1